MMRRVGPPSSTTMTDSAVVATNPMLSSASPGATSSV